MRQILHAYATREAAEAGFRGFTTSGQRNAQSLSIMEGEFRHIFRQIASRADIDRLSGLTFERIEDHGHGAAYGDWMRVQCFLRPAQ